MPVREQVCDRVRKHLGANERVGRAGTEGSALLLLSRNHAARVFFALGPYRYSCCVTVKFLRWHRSPELPFYLTHSRRIYMATRAAYYVVDVLYTGKCCSRGRCSRRTISWPTGSSVSGRSPCGEFRPDLLLRPFNPAAAILILPYLLDKVRVVLYETCMRHL